MRKWESRGEGEDRPRPGADRRRVNSAATQAAVEFDSFRRRLIEDSAPVSGELRAQWLARVIELCDLVCPSEEVRIRKPGLATRLFSAEIALPGVSDDELPALVQRVDEVWAGVCPDGVEWRSCHYPDRRDMFWEVAVETETGFVTASIKLRTASFYVEAAGPRRESDGGRKPREETDQRPEAEGRSGQEGDQRPSYGDRERRPYGGDRDRRPYGGDRDRGDRPSYGGDRDRRPYGGDRDRGDRPSYGGDRDRRPYGGDRDRGDRPSYGDRDRRPYGGDRDRGDRPSYGDRDRRPFGGDRDRGDRPSYGGDRRPSGGDRDRGDRPSYGDRDRKPYGGDRGDSGSGEGQDRGGRPEGGGFKPGGFKPGGFKPGGFKPGGKPGGFKGGPPKGAKFKKAGPPDWAKKKKQK